MDPARLKDYKTAHQLAQELLAGPDNIVVVAVPIFDMPNGMHALPVELRQQKVEDVDAIVVFGKSK